MLEVLQKVDGAALRRWALACVDGLADRCDDINRLNVFPVPDSDTGTNLLFTMRAAAAAADAVAVDAPASEVAGALARGAVAGARGNSGVILSQVLRGFAEGARDGCLDAGSTRDALNEATVLATEAISIPVEGTIVTVLRHAAAVADACTAGTELGAVVTAAAEGAVEALSRTPSQLHELGRAGVVDAGGLGLVVILDALVGVVTGRTPDRSTLALVAPRETAAAPGPVTTGCADDPTGCADGPTGCADGPTDCADGPTDCADGPTDRDYEVMYLLGGTDGHRLGELRRRLDVLGDSVVIVGDGADAWSVHVHCADPGAAVEAGIEAGAVRRVRIACLALDVHRASAGSAVAGRGHRGILAVVAGDGAAELFASEGAVVLRADRPVTPQQLVAAIRGLDCAEVLVLPNGALPAQELVTVGVAARDGRRSVLLLPTSSTVQGLAALAVHDGGRAAVDDAFAMSEAAASTRWGSVRVAEQRALTLMGTCEAGDGLGLIGPEVVVIAADATEAARRLLDQVLGVGGELVTLLLGARAPAGLGGALTAHVARHHPGVEVHVYPGGQDADLLQVGVE